MAQNEWVEIYVDQVLKRWNGWPGSLKINESHIEKLEDRLNSFFETLEKRVWIELIF